jgi:hypothetical protein
MAVKVEARGGGVGASFIEELILHELHTSSLGYRVVANAILHERENFKI